MFQAIKVWGLRKYYRFMNFRAWKGDLVVQHWSALEIPGAVGPLGARLYTSHTNPQQPVIVFFHGGGWVIGDLETHSPFCQMLHEKTGSPVISVDYRLAPEHPFPAAADDCLSATRWISEHIGDFATDNQGLILAGDSAGANLVTCTCLEIEAPIRERIQGAIVIYPVAEHHTMPFPSHAEKATGYPLTSSLMSWFWDTYLGDLAADSAQAARAFPLRSSALASLPATLLITAENDPLRDQGRELADRLGNAGVDLMYRHYPDAAHGFACSEGPNTDFLSMMDDLSTWLEKL